MNWKELHKAYGITPWGYGTSNQSDVVPSPNNKEILELNKMKKQLQKGFKNKFHLKIKVLHPREEGK